MENQGYQWAVTMDMCMDSGMLLWMYITPGSRGVQSMNAVGDLATQESSPKGIKHSVQTMQSIMLN